MFDDRFKREYTTIPFATYSRKYEQAPGGQYGNRFFHNHREIEFLTVTDGMALIHTDTCAQIAKKGDVVIIPPYTLHYAEILENTPFSHCCVCFNLDILFDKDFNKGFLEGNISVPLVISHNNPGADKLFSCVLNAFDANKEKKPGWEHTVVGNMSLFIGILKENNYVTVNENLNSKSNFSRDIISFLEENYNTPLTSEAVAKHFYMNSSYFCRKFKAHFNCSFLEYLCMYRIEKSKTLLRFKDMSISEISQAVGFQSFSYYSKMFKKYMATTPSLYRDCHT